MSILCLVALKRKLWLLPVLTAGWLFSSFWTSYAIAVSYNHTEADFPYISHTAIEAPERCVFGQMVNIGAVMFGMNIILRYLFVKKFLLLKDIKPNDKHYKFNLAGLVTGILSAFGLSMVANFQTEVQRVPHYIGAFFAFSTVTLYCGLQTHLTFKTEVQRVPHYIGAFFAFGTGTLYCGLQTHLTFKVRYICCNKLKLFLAQLINTIIMAIMLILFISSKAVFKLREYKGHGSKWDTLRGIYLTSTITEWLLALSILTFTLTFAPDFKNMRVDDPAIYLKATYVKKHSLADIQASDTNSNFKSKDMEMEQKYTTENETSENQTAAPTENGIPPTTETT